MFYIRSLFGITFKPWVVSICMFPNNIVLGVIRNFVNVALLKNDLKWNSHNIKLTILKWTIQCIFCAFTMLYNHHFCLVPKHFISKGNSMLIKQLLPIFCSLYPLQPSIWFRFQWIYQFWYFIEMQSYNIWPFVSGFFHLIFLSFIQYYHVQALLFLYMAE